MIWEKVPIRNSKNETVDAIAPVIVSASRSTDIPAFYADWFFNRLKTGYSVWINPYSGVRNYISYKNTRVIVFWSKNPEPLLQYPDQLDDLHIGCYLQYTLNNYESEGLERGLPPVEIRIDTFKRMVDRLGFGKVIWRFDPLILSDAITLEALLKKVHHIGDRLRGYTEKLVFSFADIDAYKKVRDNLDKTSMNCREFTEEEMHLLARGLSEFNKTWKYELATCAEKIDLEPFGIRHNRCIDDKLMIRLFPEDKELMDFLAPKQRGISGEEPAEITAKTLKDKGQRKYCGCIVSKDIGEYNTCPHQCDYCYANDSSEKAKRNFSLHGDNKYSETISGK